MTTLKVTSATKLFFICYPVASIFYHLCIIFMWNGNMEVTKYADISTKLSQEELL